MSSVIVNVLISLFCGEITIVVRLDQDKLSTRGREGRGRQALCHRKRGESIEEEKKSTRGRKMSLAEEIAETINGENKGKLRDDENSNVRH